MIKEQELKKSSNENIFNVNGGGLKKNNYPTENGEKSEENPIFL